MIKKAFKGHIKQKVLAGFILSVLAVAVAGIVAIRALDKLKDTTLALAAPDPLVMRFQEVFFDLNKAEGYVRSYSLSKETEDLSAYFLTLYRVEKKLDTLRALTLKDPSDQIRIDTLAALIDQKVDIYAEILNIRKEGESGGLDQNALQQMEKDLQTRVVYRKKVQPGISLENEKKSIFGRIKGFFKEDGEEAVSDTVTIAVPVQPATSIKKIISENQQALNARKARLEKEELMLLQADLELMAKVRRIIYGLQREHALEELHMGVQAREETSSTVRLMTGFLVGMILLMLIFLSLIFRDISRSNTYRKELIEARSHAERLARLKEQLLANMSHEIRTPLNAILGFSEQLSLTPLGADQKKYLEALRRSSELLLYTVNDILHYSKLEAGKLKIEEIPFKMEDVITDTISTVKDTAEKKGIALKYYLDPGLKGIMMGDPFRLKQIFINLMANGIKFTDQGSVSIECSVEEDTPESFKVRFSIKDTGIGISEDKKEQIFGEFSQADTSITRKYGGTGLGLTIVKKLVEIQEGYIEVESKEGEGSEFIVVLPFKKARKSVIEQIKKPVEIIPKLLKGRRILIVDDDEMNQMLGKTILQKWEVELDQAFNGKEALEMIRTHDYELVLMDIQMPEMSGIDVTREIRKDFPEPARNVPILAVTANVIKSDIENYMAAGMDDYLLKPYNERELFTKITDALEIKVTSNGNGSGNGQHDDKSRNEDFDRAINLYDLKKLSNNDPASLKKFLEAFIREAEKGNNLLLELLREKKYQELSAVAHRLIPSMVHVGADDIVPVLRLIEKLRKGETPESEAPGLVVKAVDKINHVLQLIYSEIEKLEPENGGPRDDGEEN